MANPDYKIYFPKKDLLPRGYTLDHMANRLGLSNGGLFQPVLDTARALQQRSATPVVLQETSLQPDQLATLFSGLSGQQITSLKAMGAEVGITGMQIAHFANTGLSYDQMRNLIALKKKHRVEPEPLDAVVALSEAIEIHSHESESSNKIPFGTYLAVEDFIVGERLYRSFTAQQPNQPVRAMIFVGDNPVYVDQMEDIPGKVQNWEYVGEAEEKIAGLRENVSRIPVRRASAGISLDHIWYLPPLPEE